MKESIRIGCAAGFWGDSAIAVPQLLRGGKLDYLVFDFLAEITMSILARARAKDPATGYALDFVSQTMKRALPEIARQGIKVVANAGGVNCSACAEAMRKTIADLGLDLKVATVEGDDLLARADEFRARGVREMFSGAPFPEHVMSLNAYLGAFPVAEALEAGADIVLTGRGVDSAVALGACIREFGWKSDDHDRLAAGSLAGHAIECGAQCTGGLYTDWDRVPGWENIGYPIVEVRRDGSFLVSKAPETGGLVEVGSVGEQILYEIGDPQAYILPDVVCDFSEVKLSQVAENVVEVSGAKGRPPTPFYKVSGTYRDGHRLTATITIGGIDARAKALKTADAVLKRCRAIFRQAGLADFAETRVEVVGTEWTYGPRSRAADAREVVLKASAKHESEVALAIFLREFTSSGTSMAPGTSGMGGNRPKSSPVVRLFSFLVEKTEVEATVAMDGRSWKATIAPGEEFDAGGLVRPVVRAAAAGGDEEFVEVPLIRLAWGRSGDKGDKANVGIMARRPEFLPWIRATLTTEAVKAWLGHLVEGEVERFDLPGFHAVNFLLHEALGGGGIASLRTDPQGKALAQMLLEHPIRIPRRVVDDRGA